MNTAIWALIVAVASVSVAMADDTISFDGPWNNQSFQDPPSGGGPGTDLPSDPNFPPVPPGGGDMPGEIDDPFFALNPMPELDLEGGYAATANSGGVNHGGGIGVALVLEGGKFGVYVDSQLTATEAGVANATRARVRYRMPIDRKHIFWGAFGLDISGRGDSGQNIAGYFSAQVPTLLIGIMRPLGKDKGCVIQLFAKTSLAIYDSQTQGETKNMWARPSVGAEALAACGSIRVIADYEHIVAWGPGGDADRANLNLTQVWPVNSDGTVMMGYFVRAGYTREGAVSGVAQDDPRASDLHVGSFFGGLEVRFGASGKKKD